MWNYIIDIMLLFIRKVPSIRMKISQIEIKDKKSENIQFTIDLEDRSTRRVVMNTSNDYKIAW